MDPTSILVFMFAYVCFGVIASAVYYEVFDSDGADIVEKFLFGVLWPFTFLYVITRGIVRKLIEIFYGDVK